MSDSTDAQLVSRTLAGDQEAYKELVGRYQGHVYGLAYSLAGNWADGQDIAQEAFIRAYMNLDQLREPARFAAWLRRVTFSVTMNWIKCFRPKLFAHLDGQVDLDGLDIPDFRPGPQESAEKRDLAEAVLRAVASLPPKYRLPLTMFHLDGLSYEKVADFLDIPIGTAKSLIHRAREKLKVALAAYAREEVTPMVQEVFNEHKLPEEFSRKVLENIADLDYRTSGECTFSGSVLACLRFLKEDITYDFVMGVSGSAFKLLWYPDWCPSNNALLVLGLEPVQRAFRALGYQYQFVPNTGDEQSDDFRKKIMDSIHDGRPVIAEGVVGPPECGIVTGYDEGGDILLGRSYFDESKDYYRQADWQKKCYSLIVIGTKTETPAKRQLLREALEWAVALARTPERRRHDGARYIAGLAAYDAWAEALRRDENFPEGDLKTLTFRCHVNEGVTLCGLWEARKMAVKFLKSMADADGAAKGDLLAAASAYENEVVILEATVKKSPSSCSPEEKRLRMADPTLRAYLAETILKAKEKDGLAVEHLENALEKMK